jgi:dihydroorotate dehydrogenase
MPLYEKLLKPLLFRLDPETAHHLAINTLARLSRSRFLLSLFAAPEFPNLERTVFGVKFPNPIGLAAGMDKNAAALPAWEALGFGFVEAGTVTARAQPGNPKPRIFRLPEHDALINRLGFNNDGADAVAARLDRLRHAGRWPAIPVGLNIGKSKITPIEEAVGDYLYSFERLFPFGDYFVLNVSSPNTPGLRTLQNKAALDELMRAVQAKNRELCAKESRAGTLRPLLVKIAPDLEFAQIEEILALAAEHKLAGIIATNSTLDKSALPERWRGEEGGLSGAPLRRKSTQIVEFIASNTALPVIAVGGIFDADSAWEKFDAGAALIQIYTGFIYRGTALVHELRRAVSRPLEG